MNARSVSDFPEEKSHVRSTAKPRPSIADIAEVLARSQSRKEASKVLGIPATTLERLCREQALVALYETLVERGNGRRGKHRPRWLIILSQPGREPLAIFRPRAATEEEALRLADANIPKSIPRAQLSAVREIA